jgi:hypothetical protein
MDTVLTDRHVPHAHSFFDPVLWERVRKEFILHFESLCVLGI